MVTPQRNYGIWLDKNEPLMAIRGIRGLGGGGGLLQNPPYKVGRAKANVYSTVHFATLHSITCNHG